ncbi:MAG TPA: flagellar protein FlgN [Rhodocyclaceae bacterium]|nr:flagellar protein FlgN [Rhodocyclaceae bacterium]
MTAATDQGALRQRLLSLLATEAAKVQDFVVVLEQERAVLGEQNVEPLFALAERKNQLAQQLQQMATNRSAILGQAGLPHNREGVEALLGNPDLPGWRKFLTDAERARNLNQANGLIIADRLKHNHQALAVLLSSADQPSVYGPNGHAYARPGSRHLGSV